MNTRYAGSLEVHDLEKIFLQKNIFLTLGTFFRFVNVSKVNLLGALIAIFISDCLYRGFIFILYTTAIPPTIKAIKSRIPKPYFILDRNFVI